MKEGEAKEVVVGAVAAVVDKVFLLLLLFFPFLIHSSPIPSWMENQIEKDFSYFKHKRFLSSELEKFYIEKGDHLYLVKISIKNSEVNVDTQHVDAKRNKERILRYTDALKYLCATREFPDVTFLISMSDGLNAKEEFPIFAMCKMDSDRIILLPDYDALAERYQVLRKQNIDITRTEFPWESKYPKLIWRGSTAQHYLRIEKKHLPRLSRLTLCELSKKYPDLIDAKFTLFAQIKDDIPYLKKFEGKRMGFEKQMHYKYHILIDGNVSPYTKSGWKLFTNSLIFKPQSPWVQWYFGALVPYVHYVPVKGDLSDLVEKLNWAKRNDHLAKNIAKNCRKFALTHLTLSDDYLYLYCAIMRYRDLIEDP